MLGTLTLYKHEKAGELPEGAELDPANPPKGETEYYIMTREDPRARDRPQGHRAAHGAGHPDGVQRQAAGAEQRRSEGQPVRQRADGSARRTIATRRAPIAARRTSAAWRTVARRDVAGAGPRWCSAGSRRSAIGRQRRQASERQRRQASDRQRRGPDCEASERQRRGPDCEASERQRRGPDCEASERQRRGPDCEARGRQAGAACEVSRGLGGSTRASLIRSSGFGAGSTYRAMPRSLTWGRAPCSGASASPAWLRS